MAAAVLRCQEAPLAAPARLPHAPAIFIAVAAAPHRTFKTSQYELRFLYRHTLGRAWGLFGEQRIASPGLLFRPPRRDSPETPMLRLLLNKERIC